MKHLRTAMKRGIAFLLALSISVLPTASSMTVHAAEPANPEGKEQVRAEDITKDISEKEFQVQDCMEGIFYQPEEESIALTKITGENGKSYRPDVPGTYVASYLVTPKDGSPAYTIQRNVILTDTEGLAHASDNGGHSDKKEDTASGDEEGHSQKEENEPAKTEVLVVESEKNSGGKTAEQFEQELDNGEVLLFSAGVQTQIKGTAILKKGETLYYPSNIGNYLTCYFTVNGKTAYCLESQKATPVDGEYVEEVLDSNMNLQKVLYYGYGGDGDITDSYLPEFDWKLKYIYTHIAASYAYAGTAGFTGCDYDDLVKAGVIDYINHLFAMEEPPKGELSFSSERVNAFCDGEVQKTQDIKLNGDHRNQITITLPTGVTCMNKSKNTSAEGGTIQISGGDTFCFTAPLSVHGIFETGSLYGSIRKTWKTLVLTTGDRTQDIGVFVSENAAPVNLEVNWISMARVGVKKQDADTKQPLSGAVYGIYEEEACENLLLTMSVTDENGTAYSDYFDAKYKTVYVKEITAPAGYVRNETVYPVTVSAGKTVLVEAEDASVKGEVSVRKQDAEREDFVSQGDASLAGAVYGLYAGEDISHPDKKTGVLYPKDSLIAQGAVGTDGKLVFKDLYLGNMYVKEITPPEGYTLDNTSYDATLTYEGQEKEVVTRDLTVKEQVMKQAFELIKISENGEQTETDLVEGAGFTVYLIHDLSRVKDGTLTPANGTAFTAADFQGYDFSKERPAVLYEHGQEVPVPELMTDKKGYAVSPELPYGAYVVEETTVPENLKKVAPFIVNITEDSRTPQAWRVFDDRPYQFLLKIVKKDAQTGNPVLNNSASYKIYDCEKQEYVEQVVYYPKKEVISIFQTNEEGYLLTPEKLSCGHYRIEEVKAPEGYVRAGYEKSLKAEGKTIPVTEISWKGSYKNQPKDAIEIIVDSDTPCEIDPDKGEPIVTVEQLNDEQVGSITIMKTGEALADITGDSLFVRAKEFFKGIKKLVAKETEEGNLYQEFQYEEGMVTGAEFEIRAKETIYTPDGAVDENGNRLVRFHAGDLVATLVTKDGKASVHNLPLGTYEVKETKAGDHLVLNPEIKTITLTADKDTAAVAYGEASYKNERQKIAVSVEKKDSITKGPLAGVTFGLYTGEEFVTADENKKLPKDTLLEEAVTDKDGKLTFASDLPHGKYYVKETKHLPGYLPNEEVWEVDIPYENQTDACVFYSVHAENQPTETQFTKTDLVTGEPVIGAKVQILDREGNLVEEWVTTEEEHIIYALPEGDYVFHEELAPFADGYVTAQDIPFAVNADGSVTKVEMQDDISKVEISKTILTTGEELIGAQMQVLNKEGTVLEEWISEGEPHLVERLPVGEELTLREITAPEGYAISEDIKFTLSDTTEIQKVEMKDGYVYGKVRIEKTDAATKEALAGATFEIRNKTTGKIADTITTDENGVAESKELLLGVYTNEGIKELFVYECVETNAPEGYELSEEVHEVRFELGDGKERVILTTLAVTNKKVPGGDYPKTGDASNITFLAWLFGISTVTLIAVAVKKRKKKEK